MRPMCAPRFLAAAALMTSAGVALAQPPGGAAAPAAPAVALPDPYLTPTNPCCETPAEPPAPPPFGGPFCERPKLTGDWFGHRGCLRDHGVTLDAYATNFYQGVTTGGLDHSFHFGGRADYLLHVDGGKAGLWPGLFIDLHGETLYGNSINGSTGALLPVSLAQTLPTSNTPITALTGVKVTQALSENFAVFAGKLNTLDDFNQPFTGGARGVNGFMNAGLLLPAVLARTIPYSTFGAGFAVLREKEVVFSFAAFDTNNTPTVSGFDTFFNNGVSLNPQVNLPTNFGGRRGHYSLGGVYSTGDYAALDDLPYFVIQRLRGEFPPLPKKSDSWAVYGMFDQAIWMDGCDPTRSWGVFGHAGYSDGNPNPIRWSGTVGLGGSSPFASRKLDSFGVGYFYVGMSDFLKDIAPRVSPIRDEHGVEAFYNIGLTPWCHITPSVQVVTPVRTQVDTSLIAGIRAKIDF